MGPARTGSDRPGEDWRMKRCAVCGQDNEAWRPFCTRCGASYTGSAAEPVLTPPPPGAPPPPPRPGEPAAPAGRGRPSPLVIGISVVVAVAVAVSALVGLVGLGSKGHARAPTTTTTFPATWDPRVITLVQYDAKARGLDYVHPVK